MVGEYEFFGTTKVFFSLETKYFLFLYPQTATFLNNIYQSHINES